MTGCAWAAYSFSWYRLRAGNAASSEGLLKASRSKERKAALLGLGLDCEDGHTRLTKGENFVLYGGSQDTHAAMQETAIKLNEKLGVVASAWKTFRPAIYGKFGGKFTNKGRISCASGYIQKRPSVETSAPRFSQSADGRFFCPAETRSVRVGYHQAKASCHAR